MEISICSGLVSMLLLWIFRHCECLSIATISNNQFVTKLGILILPSDVQIRSVTCNAITKP